MPTHTKLYREIHQQPEILGRILGGDDSVYRQLAAEIRRREIQFVFIAARGTSDNAARYAKYLLGSRNHLPVALAAPSIFSIYQSPPRLQNALVLGISQSGSSPDIVSVLAEGRRQGALTAVLTNNLESDLAAQGDYVLDFRAGPELSVAATKSYTSSLAAIARLSAILSEDASMQSQLEAVPAAVEATLALNDHIAGLAPRYRYMSRCVVIGRGYNYATAFETALKLKELTYTIVEPHSSADFLHGPLAMVESGFPILLIAPQGRVYKDALDFLAKVQPYQAEVAAISDQEELLERARIRIPLPGSLPEWLSPMTTIIPGQLLALHLAETRGYDIDAPRSIQKVTLTN